MSHTSHFAHESSCFTQARTQRRTHGRAGKTGLDVEAKLHHVTLQNDP